jgi:hypothetical protein
MPLFVMIYMVSLNWHSEAELLLPSFPWFLDGFPARYIGLRSWIGLRSGGYLQTLHIT